MKELEIVALVGVIGSGKNFQQAELVKKGYVALDFKDELIAMCSDLVGYDIKEDYDGFKEYIVGFQPQHSDKSKMRKDLTIQQYRDFNTGCLDTAPLAMTGRRLLQRMGTEVMRKRDPDYWVNAWKKKAEKILFEDHKSIAVADARFVNELQTIGAFQFSSRYPIHPRAIFCDYRSPRYDATSTHESEALAQWILKNMNYVDGQEMNVSEIIQGFTGT